jgi:hypothetical protein
MEVDFKRQPACKYDFISGINRCNNGNDGKYSPNTMLKFCDRSWLLFGSEKHANQI